MKAKLFILAYHGKGLISKLIEWWEWGLYSHVALTTIVDPVVFGNTFIYESSGVPIIPRNGIHSGARKGHISTFYKDWNLHNTDIFEIDVTLEQKKIILNWMEEQIKKKAGYDYFGLLAFVLREKQLNSRNRFFCSEFIWEAFKQAGIQLLRLRYYQITPTLLCASPLLKVVKTNFPEIHYLKSQISRQDL